MTVVPPNMILDMQRDAAFQASMAKLKELAAKAGMSVADFWENWNKVTPEQAAQIAAADKQVLTQGNAQMQQMQQPMPTASDSTGSSPRGLLHLDRTPVTEQEKMMYDSGNTMAKQIYGDQPVLNAKVNEGMVPQPDAPKPPVSMTTEEDGTRILHFKADDFATFVQKMQMSQQADPITNQLRQQALAETKQDDPLTNMVRTIGPKQQLR